MSGPDQYEMDDELMGELGGAMDDYDGKKFKPVVQITVCVDKGAGAEPEADEAMPTPEEMDELEKALG